jgi:ribosomal protein S12
MSCGEHQPSSAVREAARNRLSFREREDLAFLEACKNIEICGMSRYVLNSNSAVKIWGTGGVHDIKFSKVALVLGVAVQANCLCQHNL